MGLVQKEMEAAGLSTITLSSIPDFTASVGAPRVAAIEYPPGRALGEPGDAHGQQAVLRAVLAALESIQTPGTVVDLPFQWSEPQGSVRWHSREPPPITKLMKRKPWLLRKLLSHTIPP